MRRQKHIACILLPSLPNLGILIEGRISHDEVPLDARYNFWGTWLRKLPSEFKSMVAGNEGGDASNVVLSLLRRPHGVSYIRRRHFFLRDLSGGVVRAFEAGSFDGRRMAQGLWPNSIPLYRHLRTQGLHCSLCGLPHTRV
jgi:hypothetical protein